MIVSELVLGVLATGYFAPLPALISAIFPVQVRTTGMSLGYNIDVTVFGGFAPFILTAMIAATGSLLVPGFYLVSIAALSLVSVIVSRKVFAQCQRGSTRGGAFHTQGTRPLVTCRAGIAVRWRQQVDVAASNCSSASSRYRASARSAAAVSPRLSSVTISAFRSMWPLWN